MSYRSLVATATFLNAVGASHITGRQHVHSSNLRRQDQNASVCTSDVCNTYAEYIIASRATNYTSIDPCTDFDTYVCGGWEANNPLGAGEAMNSVFSQVNDINQALVISILESPYPANETINSTYAGGNATAVDKANFDMMVDAYNACMDVDAINEAGVKPLQDILNGYQALSSENSTTNLTEKLIYSLHYQGQFDDAARATHSIGAIQVFPWVDDENPDVVTVALAPGVFGLQAASNYEDSSAVANYTAAIVGMFDELFPEQNGTFVDLASDIIALEKALIDVKPSTTELADPSFYYNSLAIADAEALLPQVSLTSLIESFAPSNYTIDNVIVFSPTYFQQVSSIFQNTTTATLDGYLEWQLIQTWVMSLSDAVNAPYRRFTNELSGLDPDTVSARNTTCATNIDTNLPWIETAFYVRSAFSPDAKALGEQIITDLKSIWKARLATYTWMSASVQQEAILKVTNIIEKIGYPDISPNVEDPSALAAWYAPVNIISSYFANNVMFNTFNLNWRWAALSHPTDRNLWAMTGPTVNADYLAPSNDITFPAGILQPPFFTLGLPDWANYGAFGAVAGHELTHAFDNNGAQYDENGAYRTWWDNATLSAFENRTECFVSEFDEYSVTAPNGTQIPVNGEQTLSENIADSGGLSAAYSAWQARSGTSDQTLAGLAEYTVDQLFYMAFGNIWCGNTNRAEALALIQGDVHSPGLIRILGTTANQAGFREAFNCPVKTPTCELW